MRVVWVCRRTGEQARRDDFLTAAAQARILHCSCHGTFDRHTPLQSALHLSDGCVTAADLLAAGRLPMDLVFLSACESGRSEVEGADELMGLVRAFLLGGTHAVVVSLWRVDELAARILVEQFYQAYVAGQQPPAQALRQAQLAVRSLTWVELARGLTVNGNSLAPGNAAIERLAKMNEYWRMPDPNCPFAHPYFWAGFVMVGAQGERASEYSQTALPGRSALAGPAPEPGKHNPSCIIGLAGAVLVAKVQRHFGFAVTLVEPVRLAHVYRDRQVLIRLSIGNQLDAEVLIRFTGQVYEVFVGERPSMPGAVGVSASIGPGSATRLPAPGASRNGRGSRSGPPAHVTVPLGQAGTTNRAVGSGLARPGSVRRPAPGPTASHCRPLHSAHRP
ncbi:MAG: CHAT domain-containing protein [Anaerolineae bacterium]|nr:MAG: CHAT domain-containing protein [Anaerolineae bacterium]